MFLDMATLLQATERVARVAFRDMVDVPEDVGTLASPVVGGLVAEVTDGAAFVRVKGEFKARLVLACHRCGEPFPLELDFSVDEALEIVDEPIETEEVGEAVWSGGPLDLPDLVRQNLLLALPSRNLCGCAPLPSKDDEKLDPRWQKLSGLHRSTEEDS